MARDGDEQEVVAIVGSQSFLGRGLAERVLGEPSRRVVLLDVRPPERLRPGQAFHRIDLTRPAADRELAEIFRSERVRRVVHLALLDSPIAHTTYAHELDVIGTLHLVAAAREAKVRSFLLRSTTLVYGAGRDNPALSKEAQDLRGEPASPFLRDKREAEGAVLRFAGQHPETKVAVLRFAPVLGRNVSHWIQDYFRLPLAPTAAGMDPLVQLLHEEDAAAALHFAFERELSGVWNVAPEGRMPLGAALRLAGSRPLPLPLPWLRAGGKALASLGLLPAQVPALVDFLRYPFLADGSKLREAGFTPKVGIAETLRAMRSAGEGERG